MENGKGDGPTVAPSPTSPPKVALAMPQLPATLPAEGGLGTEVPSKRRKVLSKPPNFDGDVEALVAQEPPIILRREQLNSEFRGAAESDVEVEPKEGEEEGEEKGEGEEIKKRPAAKGKAKARAKAAGKAKAAGRPKAKAAGKAKAKAAGKAKAAKVDQAAGKAKAAKVDQAAGKATVAEEKKETRKSKKEKGEDKPVTFARRYCPTNPKGAARHQAIQSVYEAEIAPKVEKQSSFQVCLPSMNCLYANSCVFWG